ncbi:MAG: LptA/OstA family protein [Magnetovibrionaceae bacterium]
MTQVANRRFALLIAGIMALISLSGPALAQGLSGGGDSPLEVTAENGIEWQQDKQVFLARGNALATQGDVTVASDILRAYYRETDEGKTDVWRVDADGNVLINSPGMTVTGDTAVYDVENEILVVKSDREVRLESPDQIITANQQMEYWANRQMAVARGKARAMREGQTVQADVLVARFVEENGRNRVKQVEAFDRVLIVTAQKDRVTSDRGLYDLGTGIATLTGSVKITRGGNQLNGCRAQVNLNTGVSKIFSCANDRVRTLLERAPEKQ